MRPVYALAALGLVVGLLLVWANADAPAPDGADALRPGESAAGAIRAEERAHDLTGGADAPAGGTEDSRAVEARLVRSAPDGWTARVRGILVDERTGRPLRFTRIRLPEHFGGTGYVETDREGRFASDRPYAAGRVEVTLSCAGQRDHPRWVDEVWHHPDSAHAEARHPARGGPTWRLELGLDDLDLEPQHWGARVFLDPEQQPGWPDDPSTEPGFLVSRHAPRLHDFSNGHYGLDGTPPYPFELGSLFRRDGAWYAAFPPVPQLLETNGPYVFELHGGFREPRDRHELARLPVTGDEYRARVPLADLDGGGTLTLNPVGSGALELTIVDDLGAPLEGGEFWLAVAGSRLQPASHERAAAHDGRCKISGLAPGIYALHARVPGHSPARAELTIRSGETTRHRCVLPGARRDGRITGTLTSDSGRRAGAERVRISAIVADDRGSEPQTIDVRVTWTDENGARVGRFACEDLPPGEYAVEITGGYLQPWTPATQRLHTSDGVADFHLADEEAADVLVRVVAAETGLPLPEARVGIKARRGFRERSFARNWKSENSPDSDLFLHALAGDAALDVEASADGRESRRATRSDLVHEVGTDGGVALVAVLRLPVKQE